MPILRPDIYDSSTAFISDWVKLSRGQPPDLPIQTVRPILRKPLRSADELRLDRDQHLHSLIPLSHPAGATLDPRIEELLRYNFTTLFSDPNRLDQALTGLLHPNLEHQVQLAGQNMLIDLSQPMQLHSTYTLQVPPLEDLQAAFCDDGDTITYVAQVEHQGNQVSMFYRFFDNDLDTGFSELIELEDNPVEVEELIAVRILDGIYSPEGWMKFASEYGCDRYTPN